MKAERRSFSLHRSAFCILHFLVASIAAANDLSIDRTTLRLGETVTIQVTLENDFSKVDEVSIPLSKLVVTGPPSVSSEFSWINGAVVRKKVFRYRARATAVGAAQVGPLVLTTPAGQRDTLPAIAVQVLADQVTGSNDPETILRELVATGRDPFFVVAEVDRSEAYAGQAMVVTWVLYNAATVQQWQISSIPKLQDFWVEELDVRSAVPSQVVVGNYVMQRVPVRRVVLVPLRSGTLSVGPMEVEAAIMRRINTGPFGLFEGNLVEVQFASAPLTVTAKAIPAGPAVDAVGDFELDCQAPQQADGGPVVVRAQLAGIGNVRAAPTPKWERPVAGNVQVEETALTRDAQTGRMVRQWRYVIFPARDGELALPPLSMTIFAPTANERRTLRCEAASLMASLATPPAAARTAPQETQKARDPRRFLPWIAGGAMLFIVLLLGGQRLARAAALRREVRTLARSGDVAQIRERVQQRLRLDGPALMEERSERGDAYRALESILIAVERDRIVLADAEPDIERRIGDLFVAYNRRA